MNTINARKTSSLATTLGCLLLLVSSVSVTHAAPIDLLVLVDDYSQQYFNDEPEVAMSSWQDQMNAIYSDSQVDIQLNIVGLESHNPSGEDMAAVLNNISINSEIAELRNQYGADFVMQIHQTGNCGIAWFSTNSSLAYSVVGPNCGPMAAIHELGHNMGLAHSRAQGDNGGSQYPYGLGHGVDGVFATVMAYSSAYNASKISLFSNPNLNCRGFSCGVPAGEDGEADAHLAINNVKNLVSDFRESQGTIDDGVPTDGRYLLRSAGDGRCLALNYGWNISYQGLQYYAYNAVLWNCDSNSSQQWDIAFDNELMTLRNAYQPDCLDIAFERRHAGAYAITWSCGRTASQAWRLEPIEDQFQLVNNHTGQCLHAINSNGGNVIQVPCNGSAAQKFSFTRQDTSE